MYSQGCEILIREIGVSHETGRHWGAVAKSQGHQGWWSVSLGGLDVRLLFSNIDEFLLS